MSNGQTVCKVVLPIVSHMFLYVFGMPIKTGRREVWCSVR